jgi:predicted GNAT superfamily acetyltransferase
MTFDYEACRFSSDFSLAYFAMLRVSELVVASQSNENGHALNFNDVTFAENNGQTELHIIVCQVSCLMSITYTR